LVEALPDLCEEVEGVEPTVEVAFGGDVREEGQLLGQNQGFVVFSPELQSGQS
jgi:hypothetical protein